MSGKNILFCLLGTFAGSFISSLLFGLGYGTEEPEKVICINAEAYNNDAVDKIWNVHVALGLDEQ